MKRLCTAVGILVILSLAPSLWAKGEYDDRLAAIERQLASMQNTWSSNNQEVASGLARIAAFQDEFAGIKGQVGAAEHLSRSQGEELSKRILELDQRISAIEQRQELLADQLTKALAKVAPQAAAEGELYQKGLDLASSGNYLEAAAAFETFLKQAPQSTYAPSARLWIAECFYSVGDYRRAIKEFQGFIEKYPRSDKVAEAILKQGNCFAQLGMPDDARVFYEKVVNTYPRSSAASQAQDKLARLAKPQGGASPSTGGGGYPAQTLEQQLRGSQSASPPAAQKKSAPRAPVRDF